MGDKVYSSAANRQPRADAPQARQDGHAPPADQIAHRPSGGSAVGRPRNFDATTYQRRIVIERAPSTTTSSGADLRLATTSSPPLTEESALRAIATLATPIGSHALIADLPSSASPGSTEIVTEVRWPSWRRGIVILLVLLARTFYRRAEP